MVPTSTQEYLQSRPPPVLPSYSASINMASAEAATASFENKRPLLDREV
jgi:hypothetical protein